MDSIFQIIKYFKMFIYSFVLLMNLIIGDLLTFLTYLFDFLNSYHNYFSEMFYYEEHGGRLPKEYIYYSHIGGLYMIDDDAKKVYHCDNFFNEKRDHFICKNHELKITTSLTSDFYEYRKYLNSYGDMISQCQHKKIGFFRFSHA